MNTLAKACSAVDNPEGAGLVVVCPVGAHLDSGLDSVLTARDGPDAYEGSGHITFFPSGVSFSTFRSACTGGAGSSSSTPSAVAEPDQPVRTIEPSGT